MLPLPEAEPADGVPGSRRVHINLERLSAMGMVSPINPRTVLAEEYRVIKRPLLRNVAARGAGAIRNGNLIMVTSSVPGEGKSFSSINLALSIAMELDHTVLLVDADVSRPSVLNLLGLPPAPGLMDVLLSPDVALPDVLLRTNIEKLTILPAGMPHQRATELLASESMVRLLEEMAARYPDRIIVFDSPPLLVTTEARVLATHMGQIVMVVEAARTTHSMVKQSLSTIDACPVKMMLMNKTREPGPGGYYGYYAPYGYAQQSR
ncbi:MAG: XrtA-associated tyrosine autokinase [Rhodocyclaceae bacterium]